MARNMDITYIENNTKRNATFKKRKGGLFKKVDELSTLCGIEACAIIYNPKESQPEVWPSPLGARKVISKFRDLPEVDQSKNMLTQESFLSQRIQKVQDQLKKQRIENRKKEMSNLMFRCLSGGDVLNNASMVDLNDLSWFIDQKLNEINLRINGIEGQEGTSNGASSIIGEQEQPCHEVQPFGDAANL